MSANTNTTNQLTKEQIKQIINPFTEQMKALNIDLVNNLNNLQYKEYFDLAKSICFNDINLDFMEELMKIARSEQLYVVDHTELKKYNVLTNIKTSHAVLKRLEGLFMKPDKDYKAHELPSGGRGGRPRLEYFLTQAAFKKCLMRSENCDQFADYYILLEQMISFYNEYRLMYADRIISIRDEKIDTLEHRINELLAMGRQTHNDLAEVRQSNARLENTVVEVRESNTRLENTIVEVKEQNEELLEKVSDVEDELRETTDELRENTNALEAVQDTLDNVVEQRNIPPENPVLSHEFVLIKLSETDTHEVYRVIRGQKKSVGTKIKALPADTTTVLHRQLEPNPIDAYNRLKEEIVKFNDQIIKNINALRIAPKERTKRKREYKSSPAITFKNNNINIKKNSDYINEDGFVQMVTEILDEKYEVDAAQP